MQNDQDDADDLFGAAAEPPMRTATRPVAEHRKESRVRANWQARVLLPGGSVVQLNVHDLSESGLGLVTEVGIPASTVLRIALAVPGLSDLQKITPVTGTIKTTHMTIRGPLIHCGAIWVELPAPSRELIDQWVARLRK